MQATLTGRFVLLAVLPGVMACGQVRRADRSVTQTVETVDRRAPFLKAHMRSGEVYVLHDWQVDTLERAVVGQGARLDANRVVLAEGPHRVPLDSVALFETNRVRTHDAVAAMAVVTGASLLVTGACIANPKACFGSCPTFYVSDGTRERLVAEGFSASIAPALEATDIDAVPRARLDGGRLTVRMTNEALETHVVRHVHLLAVPRPAGGRVVATQGGVFWRTSTPVAPTRCTAAEGDCLTTVRALDDAERFSGADSTDLATRETIDLEFPRGGAAGDTVGIVLASRQTLLSTYVLYQGLSYMGRQAATWLAALERGDRQTVERGGGIARLLGGIEVQLRDAAGVWRTVGETVETGPLATDVRVVPFVLPAGDGPLPVRLRLTRGHWRLDQLSLAHLHGRAEPVRLLPARVLRDGSDDPAALATLRGGSRPTVTRPGDELILHFELPAGLEDAELFLESRGYYLEWMREEWMREENPARAMQLFLDPAAALREMAPAFKRQEARMEQAFWGSRYVRQ